MVNISFAYAGWWNSCNLANEIKNPVPTLKKNSALSLSVVFILYLLCNIAYFSCVQKEEFAVSRETAASIFFNTAFGNSAAKALNFCVMLSAFGNLLVVIIGQARQIREIGRQGVLPYTDFWVSTKTFGTPLGPYALKYALTILMILAPPAGDAFAFSELSHPQQLVFV
jgi:amino acid transporter